MASREIGKLLPGEPEGDWAGGWRPKGWDWNDELVRFGGHAVREQMDAADELATAEHRAGGAVGMLAYALAPGDLQRARALMRTYPKMKFSKALDRVFRDAMTAAGWRLIDGQWRPPPPPAPAGSVSGTGPINRRRK